MMEFSRYYATSRTFDSELIGHGEWESEEKTELTKWLDVESVELRARQAGLLITYFISKLLQDDCSFAGSTRINNLESAISVLENLVENSNELQSKFYRDHLNHMIKVGILGKAISMKQPFAGVPNLHSQLLLASFFHDVAYPLTNSVKIFESTIEALKTCYFSSEYYQTNFTQNEKIDREQLNSILQIEQSKVDDAIKNMNHGVFSSIEFVNYLDNFELSIKYANVIRAIGLHDSFFTNIVDVIQEPVLGILILADELQDWGRPTISGGALIPRIDEFLLKDNLIQGTFPVNIDHNFSVFKQITGKMKNLQRLRLNKNLFSVNVNFQLPQFFAIKTSSYLKILSQIHSVQEDIEIINPDFNKDLKVEGYEQKVYGLSCDLEQKKQFFEYILNKEYVKIIDPDLVLYYNNYNELIQSTYKLNTYSTLKIENNSDSKFNTLLNNNNISIYDANEHNVKELYSRIIYIIRVIRFLLFKLCGKYDNASTFSLLLEGRCDDEVLTQASKVICDSTFFHRYRDLKIERIIDACLSKSIFIIE